MKSTATPVLPDAADKPRAVEEMFDRIAPRYDLLNRLLTFRMDVGWRRTAVRELRANPGALVLDLACGTGDLCRELEHQALTPIGVDFSAGMLRNAHVAATLVRGDALRLPFPTASVDGIVSGFALRNFAALDPFFAECARVLRPGGRVALLDVAEPSSPQIRAIHGVWFRRVVPFVGGIISDRRAYAYLPASTTYLPSPSELTLAVARAGFDQVERRTLGFGAAQLLTGRARDDRRADREPRLVAHTEAIADPGDLLDHLGPGGFAWLAGDSGFVTSGVVERIPMRDAAATLAGLTHIAADGAPAGAGPRAVGSLTFEGDGDLVLPARIVARDDDGRAWRTTIEGADIPHALHVPHARPTEFSVRPRIDMDEWRARLEHSLAAIAAGEIDKVVLAREVDIEADAPFDIVDVLETLRATQPGCTIYAMAGFAGASPELLVRRRGRAVVSRPMAGTGADPSALLASAKDAHEHRIVVDAIAGALREHCDAVHCEGPAAVQFATVTHLATTIRGTLVAGETSVADLVALLHPTPAVGGWPAAPARSMIRALEGHDREQYAGAVGWVDRDGDGDFVVALRCARLDGPNARLYAGAGIVAGSEPGAEWAETQAKLQPMLRALVRP